MRTWKLTVILAKHVEESEATYLGAFAWNALRQRRNLLTARRKIQDALEGEDVDPEDQEFLDALYGDMGKTLLKS